MTMGRKVAELNTLSDGKGCQRIVAVRDIATEALSASLESLLTPDIPVKKKKKKSTSFPEPNLPQNVRFHQTPRSQNHRSQVPNPSRASIAAAQPLKHVETRKNEVLNSTKSKQFCRICDFEKHWHAQKLFVIIVTSGLECRRHRFMCTWLNMEDGDGDLRWRSSLKPFKAGVRGRPGSR